MASQVKSLVDKGQIEEAARLVVAKEEFFAHSYGDPDVRSVVGKLTEALDEEYSPRLKRIAAEARAIAWPVPPDQWAQTKDELKLLRRNLSKFLDIPPFQYTIYRPDSYDEAQAALKDKRLQIRLAAPALFAKYPLTGSESFFTAYPVSVDGGVLMRDSAPRWEKALVSFSDKQSEEFFAAYGKYLPKSAKEIMGNKFFDSLVPDPAHADLKKILEAYEQCEAADLPLKRIPGLKVAFLQVTNPDLIRKKTLDFPISIKVDIPFKASKASMRKMFSHMAVKEADIVVLVSVAFAKARRVASRNERIKSTFVSGYEKVENPEYAIVKLELESATDQYHSARSESDFRWGASFIEKLVRKDQKAERIRETQGRMEELKEQLRTTAKYKDRPIFTPYDITKAHMDIHKHATVNYYVIDKRNRRYFRDTFDYAEKSFFTVCYDMQEGDPNRERLLQTSVLEEDVVRHELEPMVVNLSDLLEQYVKTPSQWKRYGSMMAIHRAVTADSQRAQELFNAGNYEYDKYYDKRFDSVVVVRNLGLGRGSGFYVTDEMVMTNYHVVKENEYVRLKRFDDREMMGRVIARDAHLDLALVQVDIKGRPVCFYNENKVPLGVDLEIIGHPAGYQFSITRGALSAVRRHRPINYNLVKKNVLYIQTDAPINGGNSGGPMFWGNRVVGVVDWSRARLTPTRIAHGLNFAIHYSEVFEFLDHHGITVCKDSER